MIFGSQRFLLTSGIQLLSIIHTMETLVDASKTDEIKRQKRKSKFSLRYLRISLKYRPEIVKLILKMRQNIKNKALLLSKMKQNLKKMVIIFSSN